MAASVAACERHDTSTETTWKCGEWDVEIATTDSGEQLFAKVNGDAVTLNIAVSASGARYVGELNDAEITLWNKGETWTMFIDDSNAMPCEK